MTEQPRKWTVEFYKDPRGERPARDFIDGLRKKEQAKVLRYLDLLGTLGTNIGPPQATPLTGHKPLWELRPLPNRLLYFAYTGRRFIILHGFRKKSNKTPRQEIRIAESRMDEFLRGQK